MDYKYGHDHGSCPSCLALHEENARLRRLHEALLNTLAPSKSTWLQKVWMNAKSAYARTK